MQTPASPIGLSTLVADGRPTTPSPEDSAPKPPSGPGAQPGGRLEWPLVLILLAAWLLRITVGLRWPNIQWPDEIYQVLEPAHRMVFGYGVRSWEWQAGIRSLVLPGLFATPMELAKTLRLGAGVYLTVIEGMLCALSLSVVWTAYRIGSTLDIGFGGGRFGSIVAAAPAALWLELVLFAPHALFDSIAAHILVPGLYLLQIRPAAAIWHGAPWSKRDVLAGALLALAVALRPNLGPPLVLALIWAVGGARRRCVALLVGAIPTLLAYGMADLVNGQWPLESTLRFLTANLVEGDSRAFGVAPWNYYSSTIVSDWGGALPFLVMLILLGVRGNGPWLVMAVGLLLELSVLPHKEYRFLYPAIACLMPVLGVGTARAAAVVANTLRRPDSRAAVPRIVWLVIAACSAALARQPAFADQWFRGAAGLRAFEALRNDTSVCGVGLIDGVRLAYLPGYASLHRAIPLQDRIADPAAIATQMSDFLSSEPRSDLPTGFALDRCWQGTSAGLGGSTQICRYHRPGPCSPSPAK